MTNLQLSRSSIPEAWSIKVTFSLTVNFYLTKAASITKKSNTAPILSLWVMMFFFAENADIMKIKCVLVLKGISSEITYICVLTYQISTF